MAGRRTPLWLSILVGVGYALIARLYLAGTGLVSVTYMFVLPVAIGAIPVLLSLPTLAAGRPWVRPYRMWILVPWITVLGFFLAAWALDLEDILCLLIMGAPFILLSTLVIFLVVLSNIRRERRRSAALCIAALPFLIAPLEARLADVEEVRTVRTEVTVRAAPDVVWGHVIRVQPITAEEAGTTWLDRIGIPRPIEAVLEGEGVGALRVGRFETGLRFVERVTDWEEDRRIRFEVAIDRATLRDRIFDRHVLEGDRADIVSAGYTITPLGDGRVRLELSSAYWLRTRLNWYAGWWGDRIVRDFQERLLGVIRTRLEGGILRADE